MKYIKLIDENKNEKFYLLDTNSVILVYKSAPKHNCFYRSVVVDNNLQIDVPEQSQCFLVEDNKTVERFYSSLPPANFVPRKHSLP